MQEVIKQIEVQIKEFTAGIRTLSEEELSRKTLPEKWSKKEIIGHLVDSAQNNIQRFVRSQYEVNPNIVYNQVEWITIQDYQHYPLEELIQLWVLLNKHICIILKTMPPEMYGKFCNTGKEQEQLYTIEFLAKDYVVHLLHHLKQII